MKTKIENETSKKRKSKKTKKILLLCVLSLLLILLIAHVVWKNSGSNEWELAKDENGVKIWTLKTPGNCLIKIKGNVIVEAKLSSILYFLESDVTVDDFGIRDWKIFEKKEELYFYSAYYSYKADMPFPVGTIEYVILMHHSQDPDTKVIGVNVLAAPAKIHPTKNCTRINHLNNIYRLTPLGNDKVEMEVIVEFDMGGYLPYFAKNMALTEFWFTALDLIKDMLKEEKYQNIMNDLIIE